MSLASIQVGQSGASIGFLPDQSGDLSSVDAGGGRIHTIQIAAVLTGGVLANECTFTLTVRDSPAPSGQTLTNVSPGVWTLAFDSGEYGALALKLQVVRLGVTDSITRRFNLPSPNHGLSIPANAEVIDSATANDNYGGLVDRRAWYSTSSSLEPRAYPDFHRAIVDKFEALVPPTIAASTVVGKDSSGSVTDRPDASVAAVFHARIGYLSLADFGAVGDGTTSDTVAVQAAFDASIAQHVELRGEAGKKYRLTDTIFVGPQLGTAFASFVFTGAGSGYEPDYQTGSIRGCMFVSEVTNRPAFAFQSIRYGVFAHCTVLGTMPAFAGTPSFDPDDYTAGYRTSRYSPHAGLALDPYSGNGTPPDGGYPGAIPYGAIGTFKLHFDSVRVLGFVCGVVIEPSGFDGNSSSIRMSHGEISNCCYGWSVCGSQNRDQVIDDVSINNCHIAVTNATHGARSGSPPKILHGEWTSMARLFNISSNVDSLLVDGLYCEGTRSIGVIGQQASTPCGAIFTGCNFALNTVTAACVLDVGMPTTFMGCTFTIDDSTFGLAIRGPVPQFFSCLFQCVGGDGWFWLPSQDATKVPRFDGCVISSAGTFGTLSSSTVTGVNRDSYIQANLMPTAKRFAFLPTARKVFTDQGVFDLKPPRDVVGYQASTVVRKYFVSVGTGGVYSFTDSTCSFTATHGYQFAIGDVLLWPMLAISASLAVELPAMRVTGIVSNAIMCTLLYDREEYDETNNAVTVKLLPRFWAWNPATPALIGAFASGNATVTFSGRDPRDYLAVGDFVFQSRGTCAVGIYRIISMTASTVVLTDVSGGNSFGSGFPLTFAECTREGARFVQTFTSADLISSRYIVAFHGMQARIGLVQIYDNNSSIFVPTSVNSFPNGGCGMTEIDLGASPPSVTGTWTIVGQMVEVES